MQLMFMQELQRRFDDAGVPILCISTDPGQVQTGASSSSSSCKPVSSLS